MGCSSTIRGGARGLALAGAIGGCLALPPIVAGQNRQIMIVDQSDDGGESSFLHFSMPDFAKLRIPDFVHSDLALINTTLALHAPQEAIVKELLDQYLAAFSALAEEELPPREESVQVFSIGDNDVLAFSTDPMHDGHDVEMDHDPGHLDDIMRAIEDGEGVDGEFTGEIMIGIQATTDGGIVGEDVDIDAGPGDGPSGDVTIAIEGDGVEIPPELKAQLEAKAQELAEKLQARLEEQERIRAEGGEVDREQDMLASIEERRAEFEALAQKAEAFEAAKASLRQDFVRKVKGELDDDQIGRWPTLERSLTRQKTLPSGRLSGEKTDLVKVLDSIELSDEARTDVAESEHAYTLALHDALVRRNAYVEDATQRVDQAIQAGEIDKALSIIDRATELRMAVRNINQQYANAIAEELSDDSGTAFRERVQRVSYPRVYRRNRGLRAFERARALEGLEEDTLLSILDLETAYRRELEATNRQIRQTIDRHEPDEPRHAVESLKEQLAGGAPQMHFVGDASNPIRQAFSKRSDLDERYMEQLYALLSPEQVAELPKRPSQTRRKPLIIRRTTSE
jgi:hypothetical protein